MFQLVYRLSCLPGRGRDVSGTPFTHLTHPRLTINVCLPSLSCKGKGFRSGLPFISNTSQNPQNYDIQGILCWPNGVSLKRPMSHTWLSLRLQEMNKLSLVFSYLGRYLVPFFLLLSVITGSIELTWSFYRNLIYEAFLTICVTIQFLKQYSVSISCKVVP